VLRHHKPKNPAFLSRIFYFSATDTLGVQQLILQ
jgi:hypothetical protein